jgi:cobalamin-dependent methionine synthase I
VDWSDPANQPVTPQLLGNKVVIGFPIEEVLEYIDWNPFFQVWQLRGRYPNRGYPKIFEDKTVGPEAKKLFDEAQVSRAGGWAPSRSPPPFPPLFPAHTSPPLPLLPYPLAPR